MKLFTIIYLMVYVCLGYINALRFLTRKLRISLHPAQKFIWKFSVYEQYCVINQNAHMPNIISRWHQLSKNVKPCMLYDARVVATRTWNGLYFTCSDNMVTKRTIWWYGRNAIKCYSSISRQTDLYHQRDKYRCRYCSASDILRNFNEIIKSCEYNTQ